MKPLRRQPRTATARRPDPARIAQLEYELLGIDPGPERARELGLSIERHACCNRPVDRTEPGDSPWCPHCTCFHDPCPLPGTAPHRRRYDCPPGDPP